VTGEQLSRGCHGGNNSLRERFGILVSAGSVDTSVVGPQALILWR